MKIKKIIAAVCAAAAVLSLAGCGKQDNVSSTVSEPLPQSSTQSSTKSSAEAESSQPAQDNTTSEPDIDNEYCMSNEDIQRIIKVLTLPEKCCIKFQIVGYDIEQYNLKSEMDMGAYVCVGDEETSYQVQIKCLFNISTNMTSQEKAAFILWLSTKLEGTVSEEIDKGIENIVFIINDNKNNPVFKWLAYKKEGKIQQRMEITDIDVEMALDKVKQDINKWELREDPKTYVISSSSGTTSQPTTSEPTSTPSSSSIGIDPNLVRPEVKEALDAYEKLMTDYYDFMKKYNSAADKTPLMLEYLNMLQSYSDAIDKLNAIQDMELTTAESLYYYEVTARVLAKMS